VATRLATWEESSTICSNWSSLILLIDLAFSVRRAMMTSGLPKFIRNCWMTPGTMSGRTRLDLTTSRAFPLRAFCSRSKLSRLVRFRFSVVSSKLDMNLGKSSTSPLDVGRSGGRRMRVTESACCFRAFTIANMTVSYLRLAVARTAGFSFGMMNRAVVVTVHYSG